MNVVIFAAGGMARRLVQQTLEGGHTVTYVTAANDPDRPLTSDGRVRVVHGELLALSLVDGVLRDQQAVLYALGADAPRGETALVSRGALNVVEAMARHRLRRLVCLSAAAADPEPARRSLFSRLGRGRDSDLADDLRRMEVAVRASDLDWTIVRPARLVDEPATGRFRVGLGYGLPGGAKIARDDVADFMVRQLTSDEYVGHAVAIAW